MRYWQPKLRSVRRGEWIMFDYTTRIAIIREVEAGTPAEPMWWSVETHAMERCLNVLHRGHRIPSLSLNAGGNVELANSWVDQLYALIRGSLRNLGTDESVVDAFAWLDSSGDGATGEDESASAGER